jgi:serine/threonine protein kinase
MMRIGNYALEHELTSDGPLALHVATHAVLPRRALLKIVQPHAVGLRPVSVQLMREGCILEALHHPGVPRVFECGMTADRRPWLATELVPGETLAVELRPPNFSVEEVCELVADIAEILAHAHARGVVHRNIRPAAIVRNVDRSFPVCIVDWADARTLDSELPGVVSDQPAYRAPELAQSEDPDGKADVFALGVIAYEALTGQLPSLALARRAPNIPGRLAVLVDQMLASEPASRSTAAEVCAAARNIRMALSLIPARGTRQQVAHVSQERPLPDENVFSGRSETVPDLAPIHEAADDPDSDDEVVLLVPEPTPRGQPRWTPHYAPEQPAPVPTTIHPRRRSRIIREDE